MMIYDRSMKNKLRRITFKSAITLGTLFYLSTIIVHLLILIRVIPLEWISGGRITSFDEQFQVSIINLFFCVIGLLFIQWASHSRDSNSVRLVASILSFVWAMSLLLQLLGTPFEIFVMSFLVLSGLLSHLRLSIRD